MLLLFVFSIIPASALDSLSVEETTAKIVSEVTEMREESVKYFLCDDGSYIAATYAAPVHYNENGVWKEIDNTLTLSSKSGETVYSTKGDLTLPFRASWEAEKDLPQPTRATPSALV